jgi:hypothetical protein
VNKALKWALTIVGILLLVVGFGNVLDDARVLVYDLTAILAGMGFLLTSLSK